MRKAVLIGGLTVVAAGLGIGVAYGHSDEAAPERMRYVEVVDGLDGGVEDGAGDRSAGANGTGGNENGTSGWDDEDCPYDKHETAEAESTLERL